MQSLVSTKSLLLLHSGLNAVFGQYKVVPKDRNSRDHLAWTAGTGVSHARGVYPMQDTSRMRTARVKQEEDADTRKIVKEE